MLAFAFLTLSAAMAQEPSPADALRAEPKRVALVDLPESYRAVEVNGPTVRYQPARRYHYYYRATLQETHGDAGDLYARLIGVVWVDPDQFQSALERKNGRIKGLTLDVSVPRDDVLLGEGVPKDALAPVFVETWVQAASVVTWTPKPELNKAELIRVFELGLPEGPREAVRRLRQLAIALVLFQEDEEGFPKASSTDAAMRKLKPYLPENAPWKTDNPAGGTILFNTKLAVDPAYRLLADNLVPVFWEEHAWPDGKRGVAYLDGHAVRLDETAWKQATARPKQK